MAKFLTPDSIKTVSIGGETLKINVKIITDSMTASKDIASYCLKGQKMKPCALLNDGSGKPKGITIHNTGDITVAAGTNAAEQYTRATFNGNMSGVVVHYYVWHDEIWQLLSDTERGWHTADGSTRRKDHRGLQTGGNLDTIAIECIGKDAETEETVAKLTAYICKTYGLEPAYDVYTHNYWMYGADKRFSGVRKNCPEYILPHWTEFLAVVERYFENGVQNSSASSDSKLYRVQLGAYRDKKNAEAKVKELKDKGINAFVMETK